MPEPETLIGGDLLSTIALALFVIAPMGYVVATAVRDWWRDRGWWSPWRGVLDALGRLR